MTRPTRVRFRPRRTRYAAWAAALVWLAVSVALAVTVEGTVGHGRELVGVADRVALVGLGVIGAVALLALGRPLVEAGPHHLRVRNIFGGHHLPWRAVRAVRFDRDSPWATLELHDDEVVSVLAVQAVDREYALAAVDALRRLHAAARRGAGSVDSSGSGRSRDSGDSSDSGDRSG
jgi:hypothetical protein